MSWWHYMAAVQWNIYRYACGRGTFQLDISPGPLEIKKKSYLTNPPPSDMPTNTVKLYQPRLLNCQNNIHAVYRTVMSLQLSKHANWLSAAARWMLAGLWPLNQHACWPFATQYCMSAGVVLLYLLYLLVWCLTISHVCWYGVSLSIVPAGVLLHYRSYLFVWYITISHACLCGASL